MKTVPNPADLTDADIERGLRDGRQLEHAPEHVIQRAMAVWTPRPQQQASSGLLQRVLAVLTFDSGAASPLAAGARSPGGNTRQLLFMAEGHDVDLRISPAGETPSDLWLLSGQVLGPEAQGAVTLTDAQGQLVGEATLSELGEFRLPGVAAGEYTVTVRLGEREIVLPSVPLRQAN
jgi:hypothetical protein